MQVTLLVGVDPHLVCSVSILNGCARVCSRLLRGKWKSVNKAALGSCGVMWPYKGSTHIWRLQLAMFVLSDVECCHTLNAWRLFSYFWESLKLFCQTWLRLINNSKHGSGHYLNCDWFNAPISIFLIFSTSYILESSGWPLDGASWLTFWVESEQGQPPVSSLSQPIWPLLTNPCNN